MFSHKCSTIIPIILFPLLHVLNIFFFASFPCFSTGCRFSTIGPIYYEYGSMVVTFDSSTSAVQAYELVRNSAYEEKKLLGKQLKFELEIMN